FRIIYSFSAILIERAENEKNPKPSKTSRATNSANVSNSNNRSITTTMSSEKPKELSMDEEYERYKLIEYESGWNRLMRKAKEEPFVSAGIGLTCFALAAATIGFRTGDRVYANKMLRLRVAAQGFTLLAAVSGSFYYSRKHDQKMAERRRVLEQEK
ncbi:hypoxia induced protein conserved region-domain-containing protein, partial [Jimgerdemannia flammicorona]